jgi:4-hydroxy-3-polyprenylbenzoate decarboxylase
MNAPVLVAITGASGAVYATRLLEVLVNTGHDVHLTISPSAQIVLKQELGISVDLTNFDIGQLLDPDRSSGDSKLDLTRAMAGVSSEDSSVFASRSPGTVQYFKFNNFMAPMASGSALNRGMVICPCSGSTLAAVVNGLSNNLIHRAADVQLKERRKLILVPRETPLSSIHLDNMKRVSDLGAVVLPASPGFYHGATTVRDLVDFIVARILDQLEIEHSLIQRWGD